MATFAAMMRLVEQQQMDGAVRRPEFDPPPSTHTSLDNEERQRMLAVIASSTPERHQFTTANGRIGIVYFDARGRATSALLDELDDDTIQWILQSKSLDGTPTPTSSHGYTMPVQEDVGGGAKFWKSKSQNLWFVPLVRQKNGGWAGLMLDLSFSKKPKKKSISKGEEPGGRHAFWAPAEPGDEIRGYFEAHPDFPGGATESVQLTPRNRTAIEKFVFTEVGPDSKMKKDGKMVVMLGVELARAAGVEPYTRTSLDQVEDTALLGLAKHLGYDGPVEPMQEDSIVLTDDPDDLE